MIRDYHSQVATSFENGWICGQPQWPPSGMGEVVQFHLWGGEVRGLFAVNGAGNFTLARGSIAIAYGPILAERDSRPDGPDQPLELGRISVRVTDRSGISRLAALQWASAGWGQVNFIVPPDSATGPAEVAVIRRDGTKSTARVTIVDTAPGLWTAPADGRGPVIGFFEQAASDGGTKQAPSFRCSADGCHSVPLPVAPDGSTTLRLHGTGLRFAGGNRGCPGHDRRRAGAGCLVRARKHPRPGLPHRAASGGTPRLGHKGPVLFRQRTSGECCAGQPRGGRALTSYPLALATLGVALISLSCGSPHAAAGPGETPYQWDLPRGFPEPQVPASNPMSAAKVRLGRYLFYDRRMSVNGAGSCASCHRQERAFTDGRAAAVGPTGERTPRSAMSIANAAYASTLTWSDPGAHSLEDLVLETMHSEAPLEIGLGRVRDQFVSTLRTDPVYRSLFPTAFSAGPEPYTITNAAKAIAAFVRTIVSADSPYDRYYYGGREDALSDSAKRGELLFFTDPVASCYRCHGGFNFSDAVSYVGQAPYPVEFHNTGLYNLPGRLSFPPPSLGIYEHTKLPEDIGKFKAPTLRNIALTGPYMHDGSILNLEEVLDHYAAGGRTIKAGEYAGVGHNNPNLDKRIRPLRLTAQNRRDLIAFLRSLSDERLTRLSRYSNPW